MLLFASGAGAAHAGTDLETSEARIINNFLLNRANQIIGNDPNLFERLSSGKTDVALNGSADNRNGEVKLRSQFSGEDAKLSRMFDQGRLDRLSFWVNGVFSRAERNYTDRDQSLVYFGLDYKVNRRLVVGVSGQYDELSEVYEGNFSDKRRAGWLAGPYVVSRFHKNLTFDGRASFGKSRIALSLIEDEDRLETERVMLKGQLTGAFNYADWRVVPAMSVVYLEEDSGAYQGTSGLSMMDEQVSLGRVSFGPVFTRTFDMPNGVELTPSINLKGTWDFDQTPFANVVTGDLTTPDDLRAKLESVVTAKVSEERKFSLNTFYDGIGVSGYDAYGVKLGMTVALD